MSPADLEKVWSDEMLSIYRDAKAIGYTASAFFQMLSGPGGPLGAA
ncbi:MAG: hypothetical protein H0V89_11580, partial [Deltaproteobacteria bacterium]|nr:hypothetical protein [Deltaproteobacteria bacterium]